MAMAPHVPWIFCPMVFTFGRGGVPSSFIYSRWLTLVSYRLLPIHTCESRLRLIKVIRCFPLSTVLVSWLWCNLPTRRPGMNSHPSTCSPVAFLNKKKEEKKKKSDVCRLIKDKLCEWDKIKVYINIQYYAFLTVYTNTGAISYLKNK